MNGAACRGPGFLRSLDVHRVVEETEPDVDSLMLERWRDENPHVEELLQITSVTKAAR